MLLYYFCMYQSLLEIASFDTGVGHLFFGVSRLNFKNGPIYKIRDVSDLSALTDSDHFAIFSHDYQLFDGDVKLFGELNE